MAITIRSGVTIVDSGIPEGGTTGQVLTKKSNANYDVDWENGGGGGGTPGGSNTNVQFNDGGAFGGENNFDYIKATHDLYLTADLGAELAPALVSPNYDTLPAGWAYFGGGITHNANGQTTLTPASMTVVKGTTYEMSVTIANVTATSQILFGIGNVEYPLVITAAGTYTAYITAQGTGKATVRANLSTGRFEVTAISVKAVSPTQAQLFIDGDLYANSTLTQQASFIVPYNASPNGTVNDYTPGGRPALMIFNLAGNATLTGLDLGQSNFPGYSMTVRLVNNSPGATLTIKHQDAGSSAANRFQTWGGDLILAYKDEAVITYFPGLISRWSAAKVASGAQQWNQDFGTYLSTVVVNSGSMVIGEGSATGKFDNDATKISAIGDTQGAANLNLLKVDDDANLVGAESRGAIYNYSLNAGVYYSWFNLSNASYTLDYQAYGVPLKIVDQDPSVTAAPDTGCILDLDSTGALEGTKRGLGIPYGTEAERDAIVTTSRPFVLFGNTDTGKINFWNGSSWDVVA